MEGVGLGEVQYKMGGRWGSPNAQCMPVCVSKGGIGGGCRQYLSGAPPEIRRRAGVSFSSAGEFAAQGCRAQAERAPCREGSWDCSRAVGH